ncbi:MAG: S-layer homology domain-containing protein [Candidatus Margulisiibacteriota bacterium]
MRLNWLIAGLLVFGWAAPVMAAGGTDDDFYLRDVPLGHYAYESVYDLVRLGVTKGFPDSTYRGGKPISRFELASFLSKYNYSEDKVQAEHEKLLAELRAEVNLLKQPEKKDGRLVVNGEITGGFKSGQANGAERSLFDYRLKLDLERQLDENARIRVGLDTMDNGFNGGNRDLVRDLLEIEGVYKFDASALIFTSGPGDVLHLSAFPSENGEVYRRIKRGVKYLSSYRNTGFGIEYLARGNDPAGTIADEELALPLVQNFRGVKVGLNPRFFSNSGDKAVHLDLTLRAGPTPNLRYSLLLGIGRLAGIDQGLYVKGELLLWNKLTLGAQKIGAGHREKGFYPIYDSFNRLLSDGAYDVSFRFDNDFPAWYLALAGDHIGPGSNRIAELTLGRKTPAGALEFKYRLAYEAVDSTLLQLGLRSVF